MCCSSSAAKSPIAEYLKSRSPQELWKASLKPADPLKPKDAAAALAPGKTSEVQAAKAPGTGLVLDVSA